MYVGGPEHVYTCVFKRGARWNACEFNYTRFIIHDNAISIMEKF